MKLNESGTGGSAFSYWLLTAPAVVIALAGYALTVGGFGATLTAFIAAGIVLVSLLFSSAYMVSKASDDTLEQLKARTSSVKKWGGWILVGVGVWLLALAVFADFFATIFRV